jgi:hypothetical protein
MYKYTSYKLFINPYPYDIGTFIANPVFSTPGNFYYLCSL